MTETMTEIDKSNIKAGDYVKAEYHEQSKQYDGTDTQPTGRVYEIKGEVTVQRGQGTLTIGPYSLNSEHLHVIDWKRAEPDWINARLIEVGRGQLARVPGGWVQLPQGQRYTTWEIDLMYDEPKIIIDKDGKVVGGEKVNALLLEIQKLEEANNELRYERDLGIEEANAEMEKLLRLIEELKIDKKRARQDALDEVTESLERGQNCWPVGLDTLSYECGVVGGYGFALARVNEIREKNDEN